MLNLLVHCPLEILRAGFSAFTDNLSETAKIIYMDLNAPGIINTCKINNYDCIVVLPSEIDEDYLLSEKLQLFVPCIPVIYMAYKIPEEFRKYLFQNGVKAVIESPFDSHSFENEVKRIKQNKKS
ncbi:MAG: hypothetical protein QM654_04515 [Dysgonamonadaceae bacterium]